MGTKEGRTGLLDVLDGTHTYFPSLSFFALLNSLGRPFFSFSLHSYRLLHPHHITSHHFTSLPHFIFPLFSFQCVTSNHDLHLHFLLLVPLYLHPDEVINITSILTLTLPFPSPSPSPSSPSTPSPSPSPPSPFPSPPR